MKVEQEKPILHHTKLDYDECRAKVILEALFPKKYSNLCVCDKPDLQGKKVGIEVTIANSQDTMEITNNWVKANNCDDKKEKENCIERMMQLGVKYTGGIQVWPVNSPTFDLTKKAIENKIKKLKFGDYKHFERNELFIFTNTWYTNKIVEEAKLFLFDKTISECFQTVYILSQGQKLHIFETETCNHQIVILESSEQSKLFCRARKLVEEAKNQQKS